MDAEVVAALRSRGVDILTAAEAGMLERDDEDQLAFPATQLRVLFSFNTGHFLRIHTEWCSTGRDHAGIIVAPQKRYSSGTDSKTRPADGRATGAVDEESCRIS